MCVSNFSRSSVLLPISSLSIVAIFYPSEYLLIPRISFPFSVTCCCDIWENVKRNLLLYYDLPSQRNFWCHVSSSFHIFMRIFVLRKFSIIHSISCFSSLFHLQYLLSTMILLSCSEYFPCFLSFCVLPTIRSAMVSLSIISECFSQRILFLYQHIFGGAEIF